MTQSLPLWLDLKKEYVDDNFEQLLEYLNKARHGASDDPFYDRTLSLLAGRSDDLLQELASSDILGQEPSAATLDFNIRLLTARLLSSSGSPASKELFIAIIYLLLLRLPKLSEPLMQVASDALKADSLENPGVNFRDIQNFHPEVFAHLIIDHSSFGSPLKQRQIFERHGRAWLSDTGLTLTATGGSLSEERSTRWSHSLETPFGCRFATSAGERLKPADASSHAAIELFVADFLKNQKLPLKADAVKKRRRLANGEETTVRITSISYTGEISLATDDPAVEPLEGIAVFHEPSVVMYKTDLIHKNMKVGNRLRATYEKSVGGKARFCFEEQLKQFIVEDMRSEYPDADAGEFYALMKAVKGKYAFWLSARGAGVCTYVNEDYQAGDIALLRIHNYDYGKNYGKINADIIGPAEDDFDPITGFDEHEVRRGTIQAFCESTPEPAPFNPVPERESEIPELILFLLPRLFYLYQRELHRPLERLAYLANARALASLTGDRRLADFLKFNSDYLRCVVDFAEGKSIAELNVEPDPAIADSPVVKTRLAILNLLREYGRPDYSELLDATARRAADPDAEPILPKLARLIQAANSVRDTLSAASLNIFKREIIRALSIDNEDDVDLEADGKAYIGVESQTMEFKTSLVFPPDYNMQPNQAQQTHNVFRSVCGFLNSTVGGTLYLGVNDAGYVTGLDQDYNFLKSPSPDAYMRVHIQDPLIREFGIDVMNYIHVDSAYDDKVVMIRVEPHPFRIVELGDTAYQRFDRETREMTDRTKAELMTKKMVRDRNRMAFTLELQHAMSKRRQAVVRGFVDEKGIRHDEIRVEPYVVMPEEGIAVCLDCEKKNAYPMRISQMEYVEVEESAAWCHAHLHRPIVIDAFRSNGPSDIPVSLQLDSYAKSMMTELYPRTRDRIEPCKGNDNIWYYTDTVRSLDGIGRFCLSYGDHITILDAPGLADHIASLAKRFIPNN